MNKSLKVFLACFLGAFIGTLVAFQINGVFWWLGLLAGGLIGYLSYEFKDVILAVRRTWNLLFGLKLYPRNFVTAFLYTISLYLWLALGGMLVTGLVDGPKVFRISDIVFISIIGAAMAFLTGLISIFNEFDTEQMEVLGLIWRFNPVFVLFYYLPKGIILFVLQLPKVFRKAFVLLAQFLKLLFKFIKTIFILIHSEIRLLCAIDAAIGTAIGYFAGSAIIGGIFGGLFGVLNYEVLSKRILHLAPQKKT